MEASAPDAAKTGVTVASCLNHIKNNRVEWLVLSLILYSIGALDKAIAYGSGMCL